MDLQAVAFYVLGFIACASAFMVVAARNPVRSVMFLILTFFTSAGLFVLIGAEFLAMLLVVVYVGAVAVLFLFVVMMLEVDAVELRQGFLQYLPFGALIALILLIELVFVGAATRFNVTADQAPLGIVDGVTNAEAIGQVLYDRYVYAFQASGIVLLVAMIGAIVLTLRHRDGVRRQDIGAQVARRRKDAVELIDVKPGRACDGRRGEQNTMISLGHYLTLGAILFTIGVFGIFVNRKNVIIILMSIELILLAVNINLVAFSAFAGDVAGQVFAMFVLTVAAAEAAVGLAILVVYFRNRGDIAVEGVNLMKG